MQPSTLEMAGVPVAAVSTVRRREHLFYIGMAVAIALTVVAGFSRTYYLRVYYGRPPLMPLLHLHGLVFSSWVVLLLAPTTLVAAHRTDLHRRLGVAGAALALLMVLLGTATAIIRAGQGATPPGGPPPLVFLAIPLADMVMFTGLVGAGLYFRRRPDVHKRLMLLATIALLAAAVARLPLPVSGPLVFFGLTDLFIVACVAYDLLTRGRVHRATLLGGLALVASQPLRLMISGTGAWLAFAGWLTR